MRPFQQASTSERATEPYGAFHRSCKQRRQPTRFGRTILAVRPRPPSRLRSTTRRPVRLNTTPRTIRGRTTPRFTLHRNSSTKRLETDPHGKWSISGHTPRQEDITQARLELASNFLSVIQCISLHQRTPEEVNCGHTTPRIGQHGWSLKSGLVSPAVGQEEVCHFWLATPCISPQMMEARALNCGLMTLPTVQHGG